MSGRVGKQRGTAANIETATTTVNERILKVRLPARWWLHTAGPATSLRARGNVAGQGRPAVTGCSFALIVKNYTTNEVGVVFRSATVCTPTQSTAWWKSRPVSV